MFFVDNLFFMNISEETRLSEMYDYTRQTKNITTISLSNDENYLALATEEVNK